jgi:hypothetical protein
MLRKDGIQHLTRPERIFLTLAVGQRGRQVMHNMSIYPMLACVLTPEPAAPGASTQSRETVSTARDTGRQKLARMARQVATTRI